MKIAKFVMKYGILVLMVVGLFSISGAAQAEDNTLVFASAAEVRTMDPHITMDNTAWRSIYYCYDRLVELVGGTTDIQPGLATSWEVSEDKTKYTFNLREGIEFSDGTPFNAEAVKFNFDRLLDIGSAPSGLFKVVTNVEVIDEYTVEFTLDHPFAPFIKTLATNQASIVSPGIMEYEEDDDYAQDWLSANTAGTGPFVLESWERGRRMVLSKKEDYWGELAKLDQVIIRFISESSEIRMLMERGEVDMSTSLTIDQMEAMRGTEGIVIVEEPSFMCQYVYLNNQNEYLKHVKVRQAISYAVDYDGIIESLYRGHATQMRGPIPQGLSGHSEDVYQYHQDFDKARALLEAAGYEDGFSVEIMVSPTVPEWRKMATVIQDNLSNIGIDLEVRSYAWPTLRDKLDRGDFDMSFGYWTPDYPDADMFTWYWFLSDNGGLAGNRSFYDNHVMDELVTLERREVDTEKRMALFEGIQWIAVSDAPYVYLLQANHQVAMRDRVKGYEYNPMLLRMPNFNDISVSE